MKAKIEKFDNGIQSLNEWMKQLDDSTYKKLDPWPDELWSAYRAYKTLVDEIGPARQAYQEITRQNMPCRDPGKLVEIADLAIKWAEVALRATEGRLDVLQTWKHVYDDVPDVKSHIHQIESNLSSGKKPSRR
ncbi:uncharacterized protein N7496_004426 [Penicillium cataractarum]|uniref:Uncharacterized protein n=1 Tax=Penicillium cataractarum TaxID=2100454 RepID=A0A9W9VH43_9EURO|nr:uncharacterized protein N7496_004426 [Penicillium cataractarum]KAJ5381998.1 hypothetical protein N7496_004426 [Penicillium cataractarum]